MSSVFMNDKFALLTADATAGGVVTIASTVGWLVGATVYIRDNNSAPLECVLAEVLTSTTMRLRAKDAVTKYGGSSDLSAYTLAQNASVAADGQVVAVRAVGIVPYDKV